jgi:glycosyltransferase involved in cell wall biosynthesis
MRSLKQATLEMQINVLRHADVRLMVSQKLRSHVKDYISVCDSHTFVIPSLARSDIFRYDADRRDYMRSRLGLKGKLVLGYSGSVSPWQKVDKVMDVLNGILNKGLEAVLLLLTREIEEARSLAKKKGCMAFTRIMNCDYLQLGDHIMCFDVGFLLRDRLMLNRVASPTKFAEYMLCGVPAFVSAGIGDLDDIVRLQQVGVLVHDLTDDDEIAQAFDHYLRTRFDREVISKFGRKTFARESYISIYETIYSGDCMIGLG